MACSHLKFNMKMVTESKMRSLDQTELGGANFLRITVTQAISPVIPKRVFTKVSFRLSLVSSTKLTQSDCVE